MNSNGGSSFFGSDWLGAFLIIAILFYTLSTEEMVHMQKLHNAVTQIIQEYRKTKGEPPADMLAVYEYLHGKQIEKAGDVKAKQTLFLG